MDCQSARVTHCAGQPDGGSSHVTSLQPQAGLASWPLETEAQRVRKPEARKLLEGGVGFESGSLPKVNILLVSPSHFLPSSTHSCCVSTGRLLSFSEPQ